MEMLCGHTDLVTCAVTNPSGQLLLTGSLDNTLKIWKLKSHELTYTFKEGAYALKPSLVTH